MSINTSRAFSSHGGENSQSTDKVRSVHAEQWLSNNYLQLAVLGFLSEDVNILNHKLRDVTAEGVNLSILTFGRGDNEPSRFLATGIANSTDRSCHEITMNADNADNVDDDRNDRRLTLAAICSHELDTDRVHGWPLISPRYHGRPGHEQENYRAKTTVDAPCIHERENRQKIFFIFGGERATDVDNPRKTTNRTQNRMKADCHANQHDDFSSWSSSTYYYSWMYSAYNTNNEFLQGTRLDALYIHGQFEEVEK